MCDCIQEKSKDPSKDPNGGRSKALTEGRCKSRVGPLINLSSNEVAFDVNCLASLGFFLAPGGVPAFNTLPNFVGGDLEQIIVVSKTCPNVVASSWMLTGFETPVSISFDGGRTWTLTYIPYLRCLGGEYIIISDPWMDFSVDGKYIYHNVITIGGTPDKPPYYATLLVTRGKLDFCNKTVIWSKPTVVADTSNVNQFFDKNSILADIRDPRRAYVLSAEFEFNTGIAHMSFSRTCNRGKTWEPVRRIYNPAADLPLGITFVPNDWEATGLIMKQLPQCPNILLAFTTREYFRLPLRYVDVAVLRSHDRGDTWENNAITIISPVPLVSVRDPAAGIDSLNPSGLYRVSISINRTFINVAVNNNLESPNVGTIYVVYAAAFMGVPSRIYVQYSRDNGLSWSNPIMVNRTPPTTIVGANYAFSPGIAVLDNGLIGIGYYDQRFYLGGTNPLNADYWLAIYKVTGATLTFIKEIRLTDTSFNVRAALVRGGYFLGDYNNIDAVGKIFHVAFVVTNNVFPRPAPIITPGTPTIQTFPGNPQDVVYRRVKVSNCGENIKCSRIWSNQIPTTNPLENDTGKDVVSIASTDKDTASSTIW